jgi:hypothetical protein
MPVIPAMGKAEVGGSWSETGPGQLCGTLPGKKKPMKIKKDWGNGSSGRAPV